MSDPNESFNQGLYGQPMSAGGDLNEWAKGNSVRNLNNERLAEQNRVHIPDSEPYKPVTLDTGPFRFGGGAALGSSLAGRKAAVGLLLLIFVGLPLYRYSIPLWVALYPAAAAVAGAAALATYNSSGGPGLGPQGQLILGGLIGFIVAWPATLVDKALARFKPYWWIRHVARLGLIFFWADFALTLRDGRMLRIAQMQRKFPTLFVWSPQNITLALVAVVVMHFWLSGMPAVKSLWRRLRGTPSTPSDVPVSL